MNRRSYRAAVPRTAARIFSPPSAIALGLWCALVSSAAAQEISVYGGAMASREVDAKSYAWKLEYEQGISEHFLFSWGWLNEGHVLGHHRDGHTLQFWARQDVLGRRLSLALGAGGYRFFDTQEAPTAQGYADVHGTGAILSATAGYYFTNRVVLRGEINRIWAPSTSIDTWTALVGVGYQLQAPAAPGPRPKAEKQSEWNTHNEVTLFVGRTIVNSFESQKGVAAQISYRRGIARYFDWSIALIHEGDPDVIRRNGLASQVWAARTFFDAKLEIGVGVGVYYAIDEKYDPGPDGTGTGTLAGLVTPTFGWRFASHWEFRFAWDRTVTTYDRDTDIFNLGVGYRF